MKTETKTKYFVVFFLLAASNIGNVVARDLQKLCSLTSERVKSLDIKVLAANEFNDIAEKVTGNMTNSRSLVIDNLTFDIPPLSYTESKLSERERILISENENISLKLSPLGVVGDDLNRIMLEYGTLLNILKSGSGMLNCELANEDTLNSYGKKIVRQATLNHIRNTFESDEVFLHEISPMEILAVETRSFKISYYNLKIDPSTGELWKLRIYKLLPPNEL